jgi:transposase-like protein
VTPRERVARALREGASQSEAAREAKVSKRTVQRWLREPTFAALLRAETLVTAGHVPEPAKEVAAVRDQLPPSRAWVSVPDLEVLGSALHPLSDRELTDRIEDRPAAVVSASVVKVEMCTDLRRVAAVRDALARGVVPCDPPPGARVVPLTLFGLHHVQRERSDLLKLTMLAGFVPYVPDAE